MAADASLSMVGARGMMVHNERRYVTYLCCTVLTFVVQNSTELPRM
jgi:hypothetical protein